MHIRDTLKVAMVCWSATAGTRAQRYQLQDDNAKRNKGNIMAKVDGLMQHWRSRTQRTRVDVGHTIGLCKPVSAAICRMPKSQLCCAAAASTSKLRRTGRSSTTRHVMVHIVSAARHIANAVQLRPLSL